MRALRILLALLVLGDSTLLSWAQQPASRPGPGTTGLVIIVGGVGGMDIIGACAESALQKAGVRHEIREFVWTHGWGQLFKDLQDSDHTRRKAEELAQAIRRHQTEFPGRPVFLVGKSGGTGIVLAALEILEPESVERAILLSAAVSPNYDLRRALRATRLEIVSFHSAYDQLILNWGTRTFGTMDRQYVASAGLGGFVPPAALDAEGTNLYRRLVQVPWHLRAGVQGMIGPHSATSLPGFLTTHVAPWLR
jgi:Serine aminopeptidase, S33